MAKSPEHIKSTQKSVQKLLDKGHAELLKDLPKEVLQKFIEKLVQHYMC